MKVQEKKDSHVHKRVKKEREDHAKRSYNKSDGDSGPSVYLTIIITFIIHMVISTTYSGPSIHLTISIISLHMHILI
jgi:hypothetical protein